MGLRHIFLHLDSQPLRERRLAVCLDIARRHDAHVTAVFSQVDGVIPSYGLPEGLPKTTAATGGWVIDGFAALARQVGVRFDAHVAPLGGPGEVIKHTTEGARDADLAILGQFDEPHSHGEVPADLTGQVIQHCGRPVLVVPYLGAFPVIGRRVLVGWNGTREAARAVNDAIPLMRDAEIVHLLHITPPHDMDIALETTAGGLVRHLRLHGIKAEPAREPLLHGLSVADTLVSRTTDYGSDLLVLGGYGHMGLQTILRTGVTKTLVNQITIPTLLSH